MVSSNAIGGVSKVVGSIKQCDSCMRAKLFTRPYARYSKRERAKVPLEYIHIDTFGPTRVASVHGEYYKVVYWTMQQAINGNYSVEKNLIVQVY